MRTERGLVSLDVFPPYMGGRTCLWGRYVWEFAPGHRLQNKWGWVAQHRLVGEVVAGRPLLPDECVHHVDENPQNNAPENLRVMTRRSHRSLHAKKQKTLRDRVTVPQVEDALRGRTIKQAAAILRTDHQTLRSNFPVQVAPRKRVSPMRYDHPHLREAVRFFAKSDEYSLRDAVRLTRTAAPTLLKCMRRYRIRWVHKQRPGRPPKATRHQSTARARAPALA